MRDEAIHAFVGERKNIRGSQPASAMLPKKAWETPRVICGTLEPENSGAHASDATPANS